MGPAAAAVDRLNQSDGAAGARLCNGRIELTMFRRPVVAPRPPIGLTATWPGQIDQWSSPRSVTGLAKARCGDGRDLARRPAPRCRDPNAVGKSTDELSGLPAAERLRLAELAAGWAGAVVRGRSLPVGVDSRQRFRPLAPTRPVGVLSARVAAPGSRPRVRGLSGSLRKPNVGASFDPPTDDADSRAAPWCTRSVLCRARSVLPPAQGSADGRTTD